MTRTGRPRKPKAEDNQTLVQADVSTPVCPSWLDSTGKSIWKTTVAELKKMQVINKIDLPILALYCDGYSRYLAYSAEAKQGFAAPKDRTANVNYQRQAYSQVVICAKELGTSPAARSKLVVTTPDDSNKWTGATGLLGKK